MSTSCLFCLGTFFAAPVLISFHSPRLNLRAGKMKWICVLIGYLKFGGFFFFSARDWFLHLSRFLWFTYLTTLSLEKVVKFCIHKFVWSLWFLCILQESDQWKGCETGPAVFFCCDEKNLSLYWYRHPSNWLCQYLLMFKMIKMETGFLEFLIVTARSVFPVLGRDIAKKMISRLFGYSSQLFYSSPSLKFPLLCFPFNLSWW